jgi:ABC-type Fe3+-siderophore transport system permease subunit
MSGAAYQASSEPARRAVPDRRVIPLRRRNDRRGVRTDLSVGGLSALPLAAFAGALIRSWSSTASPAGNAVPVTTLILAGVALSSLATAITSYLMLKDTSSTVRLFGRPGQLQHSNLD